MTGATFEHCHQCKRETPTMHLKLSSGHVGRVCAECRTCRRGHPFASKSELTAKGRKARGQGRNGNG
jgi:hypothetical protein